MSQSSTPAAMSAKPHLQPVGTDDVFRYPIPLGVRLESHGWFQFHHSWWRTSDFRRDADRDVRGVFLDLLCASQDEDPVGTLPVSDSDLAWVARISLDEWVRLMARPITPLYGWSRCIVSDGRVRLYHPKLLTVTKSAAQSKVDAEQRRADDRERKRLKDLPERILRAGGSRRLSEDQSYVVRLDQVLCETLEPGTSRTVLRVKQAMEQLDLASMGR